MAALFVLNLAAVLLLFVTMRRYLISGRANPWYLFYYPVSVVLVMGFQAGAMLRVLGLRMYDLRGRRIAGRRSLIKSKVPLAKEHRERQLAISLFANCGGGPCGDPCRGRGARPKSPPPSPTRGGGSMS